MKEKQSKRSRLGFWFLRKILVENGHSSLAGDFEEIYSTIAKEEGTFRALCWYWGQIIKSTPSYIKNSILWSAIMLKNYFKIALRNLIKHKGISFINVFGLAVGMTCTILIFLWVNQQFSYDQWQNNKDEMYRLESETWVVMPPFLGETAKVFPEVEQMVRFYFWVEPTLKYKENNFTVTDFAYVDSTVFQIFNFNFLVGDPGTALLRPNSVVLTKSIALGLFGNEGPLGKVIKMNNVNDYTVTGVIEDVKKLHMNINAFASVTDITRRAGNDNFLTSRNNNFSIYVQVAPNVNVADLEQKINTRASEVDKYNGDKLILRPFNDIYFANNLLHESHTKHGNMNLVIIFSVIAVLILGIACINFINLTVAKTSKREKEIAVRKVAGAMKRSIQTQFFGETFIIVAISFLFALIFINLFLPNFNTFTGEEIHLSSINLKIVLIFSSVLLFTAFISGIYPAFYLSVLQPAAIFKGKSKKGRKDSILSKMLIAFQFAISIFLIISAFTVVKQMRFMQNKKLGINHEHVLTTNIRGDRFSGDAEKVLSSKNAFKERLKSNHSVQGVTYLNQLPGKITNTWSLFVTDQNDLTPFRVINADPDFVDLMEIEIVEGRNFSYEMSADLNNRFLINEEAVKQMQFDNPTTSSLNSGRFEIVGVVKDFHYNSLHSQIEPMAIAWNTYQRRACIKFSGFNIDETINHIKNVYNEFCPDFAFEYDFLDQSFAKQYNSEKQLESLIKYFVGLAIILSCLGLFALTAFVAERKTKEIGIRKVLGSSNSGIVVLLSKTFTKWVIAANVISWPIAYFILDKWLQNFAYHINIGLAVFVVSALFALVIALLTVGFQAIKASLMNPIDALRYE
jgi:putative ABC transport system permease protein